MEHIFEYTYNITKKTQELFEESERHKLKFSFARYYRSRVRLLPKFL